VLYVSLHEWPFYPGTGGPGEGNETTVNVPMAALSGEAEYEQGRRLAEQNLPAQVDYETHWLVAIAER